MRLAREEARGLCNIIKFVRWLLLETVKMSTDFLREQHNSYPDKRRSYSGAKKRRVKDLVVTKNLILSRNGDLIFEEAYSSQSSPQRIN